jgi:hypothetical protein
MDKPRKKQAGSRRQEELACHLLLAHFFLSCSRTLRRKQYDLPKYCWTFTGLHGVTSQETVFFIVTAERNSNLTKMYLVLSFVWNRLSRASVLFVTFYKRNADIWIKWGYYTKSWEVTGSIADEVIGFFNRPNPSSCNMALGSTQPLTGMSTRTLPVG